MTPAQRIARVKLRRRGLGGATIRRRLASLFEYLCEKNAVTHNPVKGVERPKTESGEGKTPAIGDHQARDLLAAPDADTVKSKRDRAVQQTKPVGSEAAPARDGENGSAREGVGAESCYGGRVSLNRPEHDAARFHPQMEAGRAYRAQRGATALSRPLQARRASDPGRGRPRRRPFHV